MNIGILGGTFDPIHNGHLVIASRGIDSLNLHRVLIVPAGRPWLKPMEPSASVEHRVAMVRLAIECDERLILSTVEIDRPGISYTVDTMSAIRTLYAPGDELYFMLGEDALAGLPLWKEPERLMKTCRLAVFTRRGKGVADMEGIMRSLPGIEKRIVRIDIEPIDISSSGIRERIKRGISIRGLVPGSVELYIRQHGLYSD